MTKSSFKLPGTVGPWFTYWIEYIPVAEIGAERRLWYRSAIAKVLQRNPFGRLPLSAVTVDAFTKFLEETVYPNFSKQDAALLRVYFHSALMAAHNLGGVPNYKIKDYLTAGQRIRRRIGFSLVAVVVMLMVFVSSLTVDRMVRKQEDLMTASATVLREAGFGVVVAFAEDVYYNYVSPPKVGGVPTVGPSETDPGDTAVSNTSGDALLANNSDWGVAHAPLVVPDAIQSPVTPLAGEGQWQPTKIVVNGNTAIWIARIRPDNVHTSYWATVTWFDPNLVAFQQVPGTKVPEVSGLTDRSGQVPASLKQFYVAGLNDGFLMRDSQGGYQYQGVDYKKLVDGKASLVTYRDGTFDVVKWGRDYVRQGVQAIRQNMSLIVDGGINQVTSEDQSKWGWVWQGIGSGKNLVWRSGIGVRSDGSMVYVIGQALSAKSLGDVLVRAGAQRAILLDMNSAYANGFLYGPYKGGKKLDNASIRSASRFWQPSERDFVAVYAKSPASKAD